MGDISAVDEFKQGIELLRKGQPHAAHDRFHRAVEMESHNPFYLSFLGVSEARGQGQRNLTEAAGLCETALSLKRNEAQFYLNLAEVYLSAGRREDAITVLDRGLIYLADDLRIKYARAKLGKRRDSVLPFLDRGHFLNRSLGKLRHRVFRRRNRNVNSN